ncbi:GGH_2 [Blepharisma stoltei]|uniref:folate gamma-glutamyl hydrolase n=1 Tax=Blepharisma stoltei TaxID=1481888 RepID=A0AAU9IHN5_9CILI|nr:unnamed protein product [Blepharisma stoltei]
MVWLGVLLAPLVSCLYLNSYTDPLYFKDIKPTIGVLTIPNDIEYAYADYAESHLRATYVKHIESGAMRVIPLQYNSTFEEIDYLLARVNGVFFTGGSAKLFIREENKEPRFTQFMKMADFIVKRIIEKNDNGEYFPLFTTCLGWEVLTIVLTNKCTLETSKGMNYTTNIIFTDKVAKSKWFKDVDPRILYYMSAMNMTAQNHQWAILPRYFESEPILKKFFNVLGLSKNLEGEYYISLAESKKYPIFSTMFHPEKPPYRWAFADVNNSPLSIQVNQFFAHFIAQEVRKNSNKFGSYEEYLKYCLYQVAMHHLGPDEIQAYFFEKVIKDD